MSVCGHCGLDLGVETAAPLLANKAGIHAMLIGLVLACIAQFFYITNYMTWFMCSLCHEIGHSAIAILFGMPSYPAIRLDGHAAAVHQEQIFILFVFMLAVHAWYIYKIHAHRNLLIFFSLLFLVHVVCGFFAGPQRIVHLYAGQFGELFFAAIFLFRSWTGGFTESNAERPLYAALGCLLIVENFILSAGLVFSQSARHEYLGGGSFGLVNDLVKISTQLGVSLQTVAVPLLLMCLLTPILVYVLAGRVES